jgi:hypothetical protein
MLMHLRTRLSNFTAFVRVITRPWFCTRHSLLCSAERTTRFHVSPRTSHLDTSPRCTALNFPFLHGLPHLRFALITLFFIPEYFCTQHRLTPILSAPTLGFSVCVCAIARPPRTCRFDGTLFLRCFTVDLCQYSRAQFSTPAHTDSACALRVPRYSSAGILLMTVFPPISKYKSHASTADCFGFRLYYPQLSL